MNDDLEAWHRLHTTMPTTGRHCERRGWVSFFSMHQEQNQPRQCSRGESARESERPSMRGYPARPPAHRGVCTCVREVCLACADTTNLTSSTRCYLKTQRPFVAFASFRWMGLVHVSGKSARRRCGEAGGLWSRLTWPWRSPPGQLPPLPVTCGIVRCASAGLSHHETAERRVLADISYVVVSPVKTIAVDDEGRACRHCYRLAIARHSTRFVGDQEASHHARQSDS